MVSNFNIYLKYVTLLNIYYIVNNMFIVWLATPDYNF